MPLLGQILHSQLYLAASYHPEYQTYHPEYQISMTKNSCFDFFFHSSSLKTFFLKSVFNPFKTEAVII